MLKIKKIAVTGGLAAGKTTVCKIFKELGAYVVSADEIVHQLLFPGTATGQQIATLLGSDIISGNEFDRKKIAAKVFSQPHLLAALEDLLHPAVFDEIERRYQQVNKEKKQALFVAEIPLLYEVSAEGRFDCVVSVTASPEVCKERFVKEKQGSPEEFDKRMSRQISPEKKADKAHYTIENNGTFEQLKTNVNTLYSQLTID
ncbi:MAG: dephospho-CoA kinase [Verrucomicrobia bacterium]|nr:dephospho-CoA kinase [Verrucomicrobiota bacterium]